MDIVNDLQEIFRDVFDDENLVITETTNSEDIEEWDSLTQIRLIVAIEKHFKIKLPVIKVSLLENVGDMVDLIQETMKR